MSITILSWNIWGGLHLPEILSYLDEIKPDIIGLQEAIEEEDGSNNIALEIAKHLSYHCAFTRVHPVDADVIYPGMNPRRVMLCNAVLSKFPIISSTEYTLTPEKARKAIEAVVDIDGSQLHIISTHLVHTHQQPSVLQRTQAEELIRAIPKTQTVLMGDMNATPDSETIAVLKRSLVNADPSPYPKPTWSISPQGCPTCHPESVCMRLDYIFTTPDLNIQSFAIGDSRGSDHLPIIGRVSGLGERV